MADILTNETKYLCGRVYKNGKYTKNLGYKSLEQSEDLGNGFYAEAYFKNGKIIIVYRGTDLNRGHSELQKDAVSDLQMWTKKDAPEQFHNAALFYRFIERKYHHPIYVSGHSLGGSLAQMVASSIKEVKAITYNAFGTGQIRNFKPKYPENVINYGNANDLVFSTNLEDHVGKVYMIGDKSTYKKSFAPHALEDMGDLDKAKEYKPKKPAKESPSERPTVFSQKADIVHKKIGEYEEKLKRKTKNNKKSTGKGEWVTINGAHILIKN